MPEAKSWSVTKTSDEPRPILSILTCLLLAGTAGAADEQARALLQRMDQAVEALNYEGTFVHIVDGQVETMHVVHRVEDGKVTERLVTLDGPSREIIRDDQEVTCIFADQKSVMVERRKGDSPLRAALPRYRSNSRPTTSSCACAMACVWGAMR